MKELVRIAFPITLGSALLGLTRIIDMTLIMRRLQDIGVSVARANSIYGAYTTLALPVFSLIPALITPISMALVPQLASFVEQGSKEGQRTVIENSLKLTVLLSLPSSLGIVAFARPILELIFRGQSEAIAIASPLLSALGASVLFSCVITTTNAILQAYKKTHLPIISMLFGVAVKFAVSYLLIGNKSVGVMGAPVGSLACNIVVVMLNLLFLNKSEGCTLDFGKIFLKPLLASALCVGAAVASYTLLGGFMTSDTLRLLISIGLAVTAYIFLSVLLKVIVREDIALLPLGERILKFASRCKMKNRHKNNGGKNDYCSDEKNTS